MYTDRSPRAWATHKCDTLLGQAQNGARAGGAVFTAVNLFARCASHDPRARRGGVCVTWAACMDGFRTHASHCSKEATRAFPIKIGRRGGAAHLLNGVGSRSSRRPLPTITGWGEVASPVPSVLHVCHASFMRLWWQMVEARNRAAAGWGGGSVPIPIAFGVWIGRAGRPSLNPVPL